MLWIKIKNLTITIFLFDLKLCPLSHLVKDSTFTLGSEMSALLMPFVAKVGLNHNWLVYSKSFVSKRSEITFKLSASTW